MKADMLVASRAVLQTALLSLLATVSATAAAQTVGQDGWASESDPLASQLIEQERKWATLSCTPADKIVSYGTPFLTDLMADDFVGTAPSGALYTKADMLVRPKDWEPERNCKLISARVRFIGSNVAVVYGRESADLKGKDGKYSTRILVWTDTFLQRSGKWQIIAVQDMVPPAK